MKSGTGTTIFLAVVALAAAGAGAYAYATSSTPKLPGGTKPDPDNGGGGIGGGQGGIGGEAGSGGGIQGPNVIQPTPLVGVISRGTDTGLWCDAPIVPEVTNKAGHPVDFDGFAPMVWGFIKPSGSLPTVEKWLHRLIVSMEPKSAAYPDGWTGTETLRAAGIANQVSGAGKQLNEPPPGGVMAGANAGALAPLVKKFASAGCTGYPRVVVSTGGKAGAPISAAAAVKVAVKRWKEEYGFAKVVPILPVTVPEAILRQLVRACFELGVPFMLADLQQMIGKVHCEVKNG